MKIIKKIINKIKNYHPKKYVCLLYFFIPFIAIAGAKMYISGDIWFLLKYGEYIISNGFPHTDFLSMHNNFHFVMQQWLSATIFYVAFKLLGAIGLKLVLGITNAVILYFLYKLCMILSNNRMRLSVFISIITDIILCLFMMPRPWVFTFMDLIIVLYIMETFYQKYNNKVIWWLLPITILQINLQSSLWLLLIIFMLPYIAEMIIKHDTRVRKVLLIVILMILVSFINPYGLENVLYVFNSYNKLDIKTMVNEMKSPVLSISLKEVNIGNVIFFFTLIIGTIYIYAKKGKLQLRHFFLTIGTLVLALLNIRNLSLYAIGAIPPLASYLAPYFKKMTKKDTIIPENIKMRYIFVIITSCIGILLIACLINNKMFNKLQPGVDAMIKAGATNKDNIYSDYNNGSYIEYRGLKPYIDARAEVFIKENNHKANIMGEYRLLCFNRLDKSQFLKKYNFKFLLVDKENEILLEELKSNKKYKMIYSHKKYKVFQKTE